MGYALEISDISKGNSARPPAPFENFPPLAHFVDATYLEIQVEDTREQGRPRGLSEHALDVCSSGRKLVPSQTAKKRIIYSIQYPTWQYVFTPISGNPSLFCTH